MIYFALELAGGLIKIGFTNHGMRKRLEALQTGNPVRLQGLATMPGTLQDEKDLHRRFRKSRSQREWFRPSDEVLSFIAYETDLWPKDFNAVADIEPALRTLFLAALEHHQQLGLHFCANAVWYGYGAPHAGLRARVVRPAGRYAKQPGLRTSWAYDVAYQGVYRGLPDCRGNCACSALLGL